MTRLRGVQKMMSKSIVWVVTCATSVAFPASGIASQDPQDARLRALEGRIDSLETSLNLHKRFYERLSPGVVRVNAGLSHGTGFFIDGPERLVVTNDHVLAPGQRLSVVLHDGTTVRAQLVATDGSADLAILRIAPTFCSECPTLRLGGLDAEEINHQVGDPVFAIGFPLHRSRGSPGDVFEHPDEP